MSKLLTDDLRNSLPRFRTQEFVKDPIVHAVFFFPGSGWTWFVIEGEPSEGDFIFFGYVVGFEAELGYFTLTELDGVDIDGRKVERVQDFNPAPLKQCLEPALS